tara:strand:- start:296 stop:613 length:318 start_codon:yes stop_codon:yes gene_type:complete
MIKKFKLSIISLSFLLILNSCSSMKPVSKSENNDEFLVQKKSPLLMPPEFDELPNPKLEADSKDFKKNSEIKELITNSNQNEESSNKDKTSENFEKLFLKKIKKN